MSVIIKGMKMPKSCDSCDLIQFDDEGFEAHCLLAPYYRWCGTPPDYSPEGCPLVEVPTPHGRLIDADELSKVFDWKQLENSPDAKGQTLYLLGQATIEAIREVPTIIEAEVSE